MELVNESPPTGVLSMNLNNSTQANLNTNLVKASLNSVNRVSNASSAAFSNSGALSLSNLNSSSEINLSTTSTNNLNAGLSKSSLCLALASTKYNNNNNSNCLGLRDFQNDSQQRLNELNKFDLTKHCDSINNQSSVNSPISTNSIKSSSSVSSSSNLCSNSSTPANNLTQSSNSFVNSNLSNLNDLSNNLSSSNNSLFCAQQLFNSTNQQNKVKRTRQRVDAGEPRNSYASIANYASNRLGKVPKNFANSNLLPNSKGLFLDQLGYLGLNALLTGNQFAADDFLIQNSLTNSPIVNNNSLINNSLTNNNLANSPLNNGSVNSIFASLTLSDKLQPLFNSTNSDVACLSPSNKQISQQQMILNQSLNWNTNQQPHQSDLTGESANHIEQQLNRIDNQNMAKSRFVEDAVTLDYNAKVSKQSEFVDSVELADDSSPMTNQKDLVLSLKSQGSDDLMEKNGEEQINKEESATENQSLQVKEENDENNKNRENNRQLNKNSDDLSASNTPDSSRCSSPTNDDNTDLTLNDSSVANDLSKGNRVDNIANNLNNLVSERINSNSSCTTGSEQSINSVEKTNGKMNGNCKVDSGRRRKLDQPQQCKTAEDEEDLNEMNQMNEMDDKDDLYKDDLDEEVDEEDSQAYSVNQQIEEFCKLTNNDLSNCKALESLLQQIQLQQQQQQLNNQINQQLNNQINQMNNANLRSTRVSDRGRMNGQQINSSNNSANSTPVNLSINSPRPLDDDDYMMTNSRNQEFYDSKLELDQQFNGLSSNLCKEFNVLFDELQKAICSRKLLLSLQDKLRIRFEQFLNGNDQDLEQFFNSTREHLTSSIVQLIDSNFQRYKMKVLIQNFSYGNTSTNQMNHQLNQSSKNLTAMSLVSNSKQRKVDIRSTPTDHIRSNDLRTSNNSLNSNNLVDQISNRLQRSSPNLLAGLDGKLFQNLNSNLNAANLNAAAAAAANFSDFKTPFPNFLPDNLPNNLSFVQQLLAQQEELQLQKQLQKENQQDSALSLITPKRRRIKASDEPRRTRTSNRLPVTASNTMSLISNSINSINTINTLNSLNPPKTTAEMLANLVSKDLNIPPLHNLNHSANTPSLSNNGTNNNSSNNLDEREQTHQSVNNSSLNSSVFPFNNTSFLKNFNQGELDVQQLMLQAAALNGQSNSNRASPISSFGNMSTNPTSFQSMLDQSPENSLNNDIEGTELTATLSPVHLRKAKLMFFYVRYPTSNLLKTYFRDIKFNKNNTAQLVKWFSNFREFYYQQIDKYARQELSNGRQNVDEIHIAADSELLKVLNVHYNRQNHINVPESFRMVVEQTVREFFRVIQGNRDDNEPSWRKPIYKIIARLDSTVPECFRSPNFLEALESNNYTEL